MGHELGEAIPADSHVVVIVSSEREPDWSAATAIALARTAASGRTHTLLANLEPRPSRLDALLGAEAMPGLSNVLEGRQRLAAVALPAAERGFIYLPSGDRAVSPADTGGTAALRRIARGVGRHGALLLLYCPRARLVGTLAELADGVILLGTPPSAGGAWASVPVLGRPDPPGLRSGPHRLDSARSVLVTQRKARARRKQSMALSLLLVSLGSAIAAWVGLRVFADDPIGTLLQVLTGSGATP